MHIETHVLSSVIDACLASLEYHVYHCHKSRVMLTVLGVVIDEAILTRHETNCLGAEYHTGICSFNLGSLPFSNPHETLCRANHRTGIMSTKFLQAKVDHAKERHLLKQALQASRRKVLGNKFNEHAWLRRDMMKSLVPAMIGRVGMLSPRFCLVQEWFGAVQTNSGFCRCTERLVMNCM